MTAAEIAKALGGKKATKGWMAKCPCHDDSKASLSIDDGDNGAPVLKCFANCDQSTVISALEARGLWERKPATGDGTRKRIVATYQYVTATGQELFEVVRYEPKDFRQRRLGSNRDYVWNTKGIRKVPYRLPELIEAIGDERMVFVVEGEKDVDALAGLGIPATTAPGGAGKWQEEYALHFRGADVIVIPDADEPGRRHAEQVAASLNDIASRVRVMELPVKDASDWISAGGTSEQLYAMTETTAPAWKAPAWKPATDTTKTSGPVLNWHGQTQQIESPWLVKGMLPEVGTALMSGQWGLLKSFSMLDLAASVATGGTFAGRRVKRTGGVLIYAAEGSYTIGRRLQGLVKAGRLPEESPIVWVDQIPPLLSATAYAELEKTTAVVERELRERFNVPLALIAVDTLAAAAGFKDENDNAEAQRALNVLSALAKRFGCCSLALDHMGKNVESGTRGGSAKEGAVDAVLALLGDRTLGGKVSNSRLTVRKMRDGETGGEIAFTSRKVDIGVDPDGDAITTLVLDWQDGAETAGKRPRWSKGLQTLRKSLMAVLAEDGQPSRPFGGEGPTVRAVARDVLRAEYYRNAVVDSETEEASAAAKRQAFNRDLKKAADEELVGVRDKLVWLVAPEDEADVGPTRGDIDWEKTELRDAFERDIP